MILLFSVFHILNQIKTDKFITPPKIPLNPGSWIVSKEVNKHQFDDVAALNTFVYGSISIYLYIYIYIWFGI